VGHPAFFRAMLIVAFGLSLAACGGMQSRQGMPPTSTEAIVKAGKAGMVDGAGLHASQVGPAGLPADELNEWRPGQAVQQATETDLSLGPGDLVEISVFEVEELSNLKARIPLRGMITLPLIGVVQAAGRTAAELEGEIRARLQQRYLYDPQVSVFVREQKSQRISVVGAVRMGGVFPLSNHLRLADALALAGGLSDDADHVVYVIRRAPPEVMAWSRENGYPSSTRAGYIKEPDGQPPPAAPPDEAMVAIDLEALKAGSGELNFPLRAGDVIHVPRAGSFYVGGEVRRPGSFSLKSRTTLDQAIVAAGGVTNVADWGDLRVYRGTSGETPALLKFSLKEFEEGKAAPEIRNGDVIIVGMSQGKAVLYGLRDFFRFSWGASIPIQ
jgi:polysaccharide biosynthesis/export protein